MKPWRTDAVRKVLTIEDTPESIARGIAIGIFLGFTPLYGLKTLLSLLLAVVLHGNKLAAVIGVSVHDIVFPLLPLVWALEYDLGFWLLSQPHHLPASLDLIHLRAQDWLKWTTFFSIGKPMLLGSALLGIPFGCAAFFVTRQLLRRARPAA